MHGGATALFAVVGKTLIETRGAAAESGVARADDGATGSVESRTSAPQEEAPAGSGTRSGVADPQGGNPLLTLGVPSGEGEGIAAAPRIPARGWRPPVIRAAFGPRRAHHARPADGRALVWAAWLLPGWALAVAVHSLFNHFLLSPVHSAGLVALVVPALLVFVFQRGEARLSRWLDVGFDADAELLELIGSGRLSESPVGRYLQEIRDRFRPEVVVDMICCLRLYVELALRRRGYS